MSKGEQKLAEYAASHQRMLEAAFRRFTETNIDSVKLSDIAADTGLTERTLYRHFDSKSALVIETATWAWRAHIVNTRQRFAPGEWEGMTAARQYAFFLDSFLELYRSRRDLLCFNQIFNVYIRATGVNAETLKPYRDMMNMIRERYHGIIQKAREDGTLRTDMDEEVMFSTTLHLMLAAVTRYAVGLVYRSESDPEQELLFQRDLLLQRFTTDAAK